MPALLTNASNLDLLGWLRGLLSAGISSFSGAIASGFGPALVDPHDFNIEHPMMMIKTAAIGAALCGVVSMAKFLSTSPLPGVKEVTDTTKTISTGGAPPTVIKTVQEKHTEPIAGTGTGDSKDK